MTIDMAHGLATSLRRLEALVRRPAGVPPRRFRRVGVLGAGLMGGGIALVAARAGLDVVLLDIDAAAAERGRARLRRQAEAWAASGETDGADAVLDRITPSGDYRDLAGAELVVEAVFEDRAIKAEAVRRAEAVLAPDAIMASNTSTLPITGLAAASIRPDRFIGLHFFSPVPRMRLLEMIRGERTSDATLAEAMDFAALIGKTPIVVRDSRGFYTSRVIMTYQSEAFTMLAEGVDPAAIEQAGLDAGMPLPPLALADVVGLDLIHQINRQTFADTGTPPGDAERVVESMVERFGRPGKKAARGFYDYPEGGGRHLWPALAGHFPTRAPQPEPTELRDRLLGRQALEAARCLEERVIEHPAEADVGALLGWNFAPQTGGPLSSIDQTGVGTFVRRYDALAERRGERFRPNALLRAMANRGERFYADVAS